MKCKTQSKFRSIEGYSRYKICYLGTILDADANELIHPLFNDGGYLYITLVDDNKIKKTEYMHRLVALTLIKNPMYKPIVDHVERNLRA